MHTQKVTKAQSRRICTIAHALMEEALSTGAIGGPKAAAKTIASVFVSPSKSRTLFKLIAQLALFDAECENGRRVFFDALSALTHEYASQIVGAEAMKRKKPKSK